MRRISPCHTHSLPVNLGCQHHPLPPNPAEDGAAEVLKEVQEAGAVRWVTQWLPVVKEKGRSCDRLLDFMTFLPLLCILPAEST